MFARSFPFDIGTKVYVDGDDRMAFTVIGVHLYNRGNEYLLAWVNEGQLNQASIDEFRLTAANG